MSVRAPMPLPSCFCTEAGGPRQSCMHLRCCSAVFALVRKGRQGIRSSHACTCCCQPKAWAWVVSPWGRSRDEGWSHGLHPWGVSDWGGGARTRGWSSSCAGRRQVMEHRLCLMTPTAGGTPPHTHTHTHTRTPCSPPSTPPNRTHAQRARVGVGVRASARRWWTPSHLAHTPA